MKPAFSYLRNYGFSSDYYVDDTLLLGAGYNLCAENTEKNLKTPKTAGFDFNYDKSALIPSRYINFLGFCRVIYHLPDVIRYRIYIQNASINWQLSSKVVVSWMS